MVPPPRVRHHALLLEKLHMLHLPIGQRILRYSSLDDIAIWGLLALFLVGWPVTNPARSSVLKTSVRPLAASAVIQPTNRCGRTQS